jgi:hypothetical protein
MHLEDHISETKQLFTHWRENKETLGKIMPETLLERVAALSRSGVSHIWLIREFAIGYPKIEQALKLFPRANRNTLEKLSRKKNVEKNRLSCREAEDSSITPPQENQRQSQAKPAPQEAISKNLGATSGSIEENFTPDAVSTQHESPRCAVIQVIDAECVQRIREHRAVVAGGAKAEASLIKNAAVGEMVSSLGTRLLLFENLSPDLMRTMIAAFLQVDAEVAHVTSQRS